MSARDSVINHLSGSKKDRESKWSVMTMNNVEIWQMEYELYLLYAEKGDTVKYFLRIWCNYRCVRTFLQSNFYILWQSCTPI